MTDQNLMKKLREDMKENQKQMKEARSDQAKVMELQKKHGRLAMEQFKNSIKPTFVTIIPFILIFGWMSSTFAYENINPQEEFTVSVLFQKNTVGEVEIIVIEGIEVIGESIQKIENNLATWTVKGQEGEHILEFDYKGSKQQKSVLITNEPNYLDPMKNIKNSAMKTIQINNKKLIILPIGFRDWLGWLGTYIITLTIFSMTLRKVLKIY
tara:strand:+ start:14395 stop:15027 length:633 start_codon:yes stop_codon:yes gene_type:complete